MWRAGQGESSFLTAVQIEEVTIVLDLNVCHLLASPNGQRESGQVGTAIGKEEVSVHVTINEELQHLLTC